MAKTVVGLFSSVAKAEEVKQALIAEDYVGGKITVVANGTEGAEESGVKHVGDKISSFFKSLTGGDDDAHEHYASGINGGGALLAATVEDDEATAVTAFLKAHGAKDIDGNTQAATTGTPVYGGSATTAQEGTAIPIIEESLVVGKREVDRGGVRVYTHVVEKPVSADVTLREEVINVARKFVDRPATAADFAAGSGQVIELSATGEEAVVGKTSRVVEEVHIGKESTERNEQISDSVRKTEVHVEEVPAAAGGLKDDRY